MLDIQNSCLVVVDVQGKLAQLMHGKDVLFKNVRILIQAAHILDIPILWCQQCPNALGPTIPEIAQLLIDNEPIDKAAFSCCGEEKFNSKLNELARIVLARAAQLTNSERIWPQRVGSQQ